VAYSRSPQGEEPAREAVDAWQGATVLEFGTGWCGHCVGAQASIEAALGPRPDIRHVKVEDGRGRPLGRSYRVKLWPTLVALRDGREVARAVRPVSPSDLQPLLDALAAPPAPDGGIEPG
jgi:thioredoxin 1